MNTKDIAIITGASSGIGKALAVTLSKRNFTVLAIGRNDAALSEIKEIDPIRIQTLSADLSTDQGRQAVLSCIPIAAKVRFLIHSAATLGTTGDLSKISSKNLQQTLAINLEAPLLLTNMLLPYLTGGRVLFVSSDLAHFGLRGLGCYCISKAALYQLYECLKKELQDKNIYIGSVLPGVVDTPMQSTVRQLSTEDFPDVENFKALKRFNKLIPAEKVADFLEWLLLHATNEDFSHKEWNIKDWLSGKIAQK